MVLSTKRIYWLVVIACTAAIILVLLLILSLNSLKAENALRIPFLTSTAIVVGLSVIIPLLLLIWAWRLTPATTRIICLLVFVAILGFEEYRAQKNLVPLTQDYALKTINIDSLVDYGTFCMDTFGVMKFNVALEHSPQVHMPGTLNRDGFYSNHAFTQVAIDSLRKTGKRVHFAIGDSYLQGIAAEPGKGFAQLIDSSTTHAILNAGVGGTDPIQYLQVVKEYISTGKLHPDEVDVFLCGSNDIYIVDRKPDLPIFFDTNVGRICARASTAREAYAKILKKISVFPLRQGGASTYFIAHSITNFFITRLVQYIYSPIWLWKEDNYHTFIKNARINVYGYINAKDMPFANVLAVFERKPVEIWIEKIRAECNRFGVPVKFILIPGQEMVRKQKMPIIPGVINVDTYELTPADYPPTAADHPNNSGHKKIAGSVFEIFESK